MSEQDPSLPLWAQGGKSSRVNREFFVFEVLVAEAGSTRIEPVYVTLLVVDILEQLNITCLIGG